MAQIIVESLIGQSLEQRIENYCQANIPPQDQPAFSDSVRDELQYLSVPRIVGMGISIGQLNQYLELKRN